MAEKTRIGPQDALIVVDVQYGFLPGGSLPVKDGDKVIPVINELEDKFQVTAFTQDWHPPDHCSFKEKPEFTDGSWPEHCVAGTPEAELAADLKQPDDAIDKEAYSGFQDTDLADRLRDRGVKRVFITGLALDVCVRDTALHALEEGFETFVIEDATRPVDNPRGTARQALDKMKKKGVKIIQSADID